MRQQFSFGSKTIEAMRTGQVNCRQTTVDEILLASEEVLGYRWASATTMLDMIGEGISMKKIIKGIREADKLILTEVSIKSGIDVNLLKRIVENLEDLDSDEPATD